MRFRFTITSLAIAGCCACDASPTLENPGRRSSSIIGGAVETGYPGVGALQIDPAGSDPALCTGTVIHDHWVLTAADCVEGRAATDLTFVTGPSVANPTATYQVVQAEVNPTTSRVALLYVAGLTGVETHEYNKTTLTQTWVETPVTWIGYGAYAPAPLSGQGTKRRGTGTIDSLSFTSLHYFNDGVLPCTGDRGGPSFATIGGSERIVGVIYWVDEGCNTWSSDARVDAYAAWINATLSTGQPAACDIHGGDCGVGTCVPFTADEAYCADSSGLAAGASCDPTDTDWADGLPCMDGLVCAGDPGSCRSYCASAADCDPGEQCAKPVLGVSSVGACLPDAGSDAATQPADGGGADAGADSGAPGADGARPGGDASEQSGSSDGGGCSLGGQAAPWPWLLLLPVLMLVRRRPLR